MSVKIARTLAGEERQMPAGDAIGAAGKMMATTKDATTKAGESEMRKMCEGDKAKRMKGGAKRKSGEKEQKKMVGKDRKRRKSDENEKRKKGAERLTAKRKRRRIGSAWSERMRIARDGLRSSARGAWKKRDDSRNE